MKALVLAYYFPPLGGAGVQRSAKLVSELAELGIDSTVVTGPGLAHDRWSPLDGSFEREAGRAQRVVRAAPPALGLPGTPPSRASRLLGRPSAFERWWQAASLRAALEAIEKERPDLIYASLAPYSSGAAARALAAETGLPWVADLRDPWALDEVRVYPSRWHRAADRRRMGRALRSAAAVVMNTNEAANAFRRAFPRYPGRVEAIPNGYDPADFRAAQPAPPTDRFRIVHTGYLHSAAGIAHRRGRRVKRLLGGERVPVDLLTRSHVFLLRALERCPELAARIELVLVGDLTEADRTAIRESPARTLVRPLGYQSHRESMGWLLSADLLFLPMHDLASGARATIVPGKTYEYLASGRPILAAAPAGDARDLLRASGRAHLCRPSDAAAMADAVKLEALRGRPTGGARRPHWEPPSGPPGLLTRGEIAERMSVVLESARAGPPSRERRTAPTGPDVAQRKSPQAGTPGGR